MDKQQHKFMELPFLVSGGYLNASKCFYYAFLPTINFSTNMTQVLQLLSDALIAVTNLIHQKNNTVE
jgi:hypothetical protein